MVSSPKSISLKVRLVEEEDRSFLDSVARRHGISLPFMRGIAIHEFVRVLRDPQALLQIVEKYRYRKEKKPPSVND
jgi:hypothetical protein